MYLCGSALRGSGWSLEAERRLKRLPPAMRGWRVGYHTSRTPYPWLPLYGAARRCRAFAWSGYRARVANTVIGTFVKQMPLAHSTKKQVIEQHRTSDDDTGSPDVQIALLTARISQITDHLRTNKKDKHSRLGLLRLVGKRRRLEKYLRRQDIVRYRQLIQQLGIREQKSQ